MELIDREPLLKILELETKGFRHTETQYNMGYLEAKKQLMEDIREMPTVELEPKWISVKDKLPPAEKRVEICFERISFRDGKPKRHITIGIYEDGTISEPDSRYLDNDDGYLETEYDESRDEYLYTKNWYEIFAGTFSEYCNMLNPKSEIVTHWRELPQPPKEAEP